nr:hypothetical protein [Tanacetum cinerariifolium]
MHQYVFDSNTSWWKISMVSRQNIICESELLFYNYLRLLTSLDEGLYALACEEDACCLATIFRSFKLIEVIEDVMRQLLIEETELDGEADFGDVAESGVESYVLSHDESFRVDDLDLNLNEPVNLNVFQIETQSELSVSEEPNIDESTPSDGRFIYDNEGIDTAYYTQYDVDSSKDAGTDDDDDDFLVDEENEIVEPDVNVHLFGISMDVPFANIGITNLVLDDVLKGEDVDVINADGFDSDTSNDDETSNYRKRRKYFTIVKEAKDRVYMHFIESKRNLNLYKNDNIRVRARSNGKVLVFTMSQGTRPTDLNHEIEAGPSGSNGPSTRSKKRRIQIFDQIRVNPKIPVKAIQDQLQRDIELQIYMSKAFRAKVKVGREIRGNNVL